MQSVPMGCVFLVNIHQAYLENISQLRSHGNVMVSGHVCLRLPVIEKFKEISVVYPSFTRRCS